MKVSYWVGRRNSMRFFLEIPQLFHTQDEREIPRRSNTSLEKKLIELLDQKGVIDSCDLCWEMRGSRARVPVPGGTL